MEIGNGTVVTFYYSLSDEAGTLLESNREAEPQVFLYGRRSLLPALEAAMAGKSAGEQLQLVLPPEQAYGRRREDAQHRVPIKHLVNAPKKLKVGQIVTINTKEGARNARVLKVGKFNVDIDANHPFAGQTVTFDLEITDVRAASAEEQAHGHVHGVGGHQH